MRTVKWSCTTVNNAHRDSTAMQGVTQPYSSPERPLAIKELSANCISPGGWGGYLFGKTGKQLLLLLLPGTAADSQEQGTTCTRALLAWCMLAKSNTNGTMEASRQGVYTADLHHRYTAVFAARWLPCNTMVGPSGSHEETLRWVKWSRFVK